jgi:putative FmdB family regulatory protein|tara:strand:+ start:32 stop:331 length:300 start_codon:yes stop_codon:yes gene_type:complete
MPIYEYRCPECAYELEILQKMGEDAPTCTMCIKEYTKDDKVVSELHRQMKRKLSNIAPPVFKGSGFYATDYKKKGFSKPDKKVEKSKGKKNETSKKKQK